MDLQSEQARIYDVLGGFLRVDRSEDALWISDYPRRTADTAEAVKLLAQMGVQCATDQKNGMWHLDWTREKWSEVLLALPCRLPPFPEDESVQDCYAFCRYALLRPSATTDESLRFVRMILKGTVQIRFVHEQCVARERSGHHAAYDAGRLLAATLWEKERER